MTDKTMTDVADKAVDKLASGVEHVARAVERVAPKAWDILVHQQKVAGWTDICQTAAAVVLTLACWILLFRMRKSGSKFIEGECPMPALWVAIVCCSATLATLIACFNLLPHAISQIVNPEYYAAYEAIDMVQQ